MEGRVEQRPSFFDVPYAVPSALLTTGTTVITTTGADYAGFAIKTVTASTLTIYNDTAGTGAILDVITCSTSTRSETFLAVKARVAICAILTGTGATATVFYTPKG